VGDRDDRVVEGALDVRRTHRDVLLLAAAGADDLLFDLCQLLALLPADADGALGAPAAPCVGPGALPADGEPAAVAEAPVGPDLDQPFDVHRDLAPEIALDQDVLGRGQPVDDRAKPPDLLIAEILDPGVGADVGQLQDLLRPAAADPH